MATKVGILSQAVENVWAMMKRHKVKMEEIKEMGK